MKITIFLDPIPQTRPRFSGGRCYEPARVKNYKLEVGYKVREEMNNQQPLLNCVLDFGEISRRPRADLAT